MSVWPCVLFVTSVFWTPTVIIRGRHPAVLYFRTWRPCLAWLLWGVLTFSQYKTTELACSWVTPAATATWETIAVLNMISLWSHFFQIGLEGSKSMLCLSNTVLRGEQCLGNENETICAEWCFLCGGDLLELSAVPHKRAEMSAVSLHGNQRDVKSMFIVLELRKCCSLQKGDDHSELSVRCCLHYHTMISIIYPNRAVLKCLTKMGAFCFESWHSKVLMQSFSYP